MGIFVTDLLPFYILPMHNHYLVKNNLEENHSYTSYEIMPIAVVHEIESISNFQCNPRTPCFAARWGNNLSLSVYDPIPLEWSQHPSSNFIAAHNHNMQNGIYAS
jgi:hypothetical protein